MHKLIFIFMPLLLLSLTVSGQVNSQIEVKGAGPILNGSNGINIDSNTIGSIATHNLQGYVARSNESEGFVAQGNGTGYWATNNSIGIFASFNGEGIISKDNSGYAADFSSPASREGAAVLISHKEDDNVDLEFGGSARISADNNLYIQLGLKDLFGFNSFFIVNSSGTSVANINEAGHAQFNGNVCAANISCSSDLRFKKNITPLTSSLSNLSLIHGVQYDWDQDKWPDRKFSDRLQIGFIAQELEEVYPEMVHTNEDGYKSVAYNKMTAVLVEAVKELNEKLEEENEELRLENKRINKKLEQLADIEKRLSILEKLN